MSVDFRRGKWRARISVNGKRIELGRFAEESDARAAYRSAVEQHDSGRVRKPRPFADPAARFAAKLSAPTATGCLLWLGAKDKDGYGKFQLNSPGSQRHVRAHRYAFFLENGKWPEKLVLHSCDTPTCANAAHLREGTQSENLIDCAERGRRRSARLSVDVVRLVRARHAAGASVTAIARETGLCRETLYAAVHRRTWKHVA